MVEIKEISRKCECNEDMGIACGPVSITAVCAEMVIEQDGQSVYLSCTWCDEVSDAVSFEVTKESIYDLMLMKDDDMDKLDKIRTEEIELFISSEGEYEGDYPDQYKALVDMVKDKLFKEGFVDHNDYENRQMEWDF